MFILRQLASTCALGEIDELSETADAGQQVTDPNPRYIMRLAEDGQFSSDITTMATSATFTIPLPQNYDTDEMLHVTITTSKTVKLTVVSATNGTSNVMIRAGTNQIGIYTFCGPVTSMLLTNSSSATSTVRWFLFQMPDIDSEDGWRDGALSTGVLD